MIRSCERCGGALEAGGQSPPCLCELSPVAPAAVPQAAGGEGEHARALRCPACGGYLDAGMRRCSYCRVELASVRCWRCFELSFAGSSICAGCGATLGLEADLGPTELTCPSCRDDVLHVLDVGDHRIQECPSCGGVMLDHETLERITDAREAEAGVRVIGGPKRSELAVEPVRYRPCPGCGEIMSRRNFGTTSGVIVDICKAHGVWFDPDELTAVLEFVATGGLKQARDRELGEAKRELSRRRREALGEQMAMAHRPVTHGVAVHSGGALLSALLGWDW